ncbi:MAG TPA: tetratricopeptide repeat-containing sensor histidine kinase [Prolixibacteraceae bacterium]|nr:tetratricopeptide repeat-containing sensor histidine kinase [Prolixibacteraceae bacterium]
MRIVFLLFGLIYTTFAFSQSKVDSLLRLSEKVSDMEKTGIYLQLTRLTLQDSALSNYYNKKVYELAVANGQLLEQAKSVYFSARICFVAREFTKAIRLYEKAIPLFRELGDTMNMTTCYSYIGISNFNMSKSKEAIASYLEGLKLSKNDPDYSAELLANIGLVHNEIDNLDQAISYIKQALKINQSIHDTGSMAIDYDYLGASYARKEMPDSAVANYHKALALFKKMGKEDRYAVSLTNIATIFPHYPDSLNKAITYFNIAWEKFRELGWDHYEADIEYGIAKVLVKQGKVDEAIAAYNRALHLAFKFKREQLLKKQIYQGLSEAYQQKGDYRQALEMHILESQYNDSINEKQKFHQIALLEKQYETEKKEHEFKDLQSKQEIMNVQLKKNKQLKLLGFLTALLLLLFIFFISKKYLDKTRLMELLEEKNKQIAESENELRQLNAAKNKFFSIIAHDLKNPIHTVMGYSYLFSHDYDNFTEEERRRFAADINKSTNNIFKLLENLLEWSRSQTGNLKYSPIEIEFSHILENAVNIMHPLAEQKNIRLTTSCNRDLKVYSDPLMIETVMRNLISNAIKFTPENGSIDIKAEQAEKNVKIRVRDTGTGISKEDLEHLFQLDSKVKRKGTNNEDGSGIGLILCMEFITINKGKLWVESIPGKGSTFHLTIPCPGHVNS